MSVGYPSTSGLLLPMCLPGFHILRMLYETAERFSLKHSQAFVNISYSNPPYQHPIRSLVPMQCRSRKGLVSRLTTVSS